ncbi:RNA polymerase subunit sigma [Rubritalea profundi]|uniref:RNA polymerase subunit sigma n=2 Tax=Rubritalea profundi TaxID=1658618 RepID=A0A2S7U6D8_9BACT|nr:RNA polymerase subunit sigma [Rubritalea profundi]
MGAVASESAGNGGDGPTDQVLVQRAQSGDYRAFDQLVTRHRGKVYAMIVNMIHNDADAWDLAQDAFVKAWKALPKFEHRAQFSTWLFRISHNVVYDWMRKKKVMSEGELDDQMLDSSRIDSAAPTAPKIPARPDEQLVQNERRAEIEKALSQLSDEHRETILLREVQGMEYTEIADIMECSKGTVMSRLFYARKKLQTLLKP